MGERMKKYISTILICILILSTVLTALLNGQTLKDSTEDNDNTDDNQISIVTKSKETTKSKNINGKNSFLPEILEQTENKPSNKKSSYYTDNKIVTPILPSINEIDHYLNKTQEQNYYKNKHFCNPCQAQGSEVNGPGE